MPPKMPLSIADDEADRRVALGLVPVSRETAETLTRYVEVLRKWQQIKNLVASSTLDQIWTRHIADSAQLLALMPHARRWVDLGSGAGFPGLVVAIMLKGRDGAHVDLIESNERKCAFLREVARVTAAPVRVHVGRIEDVLPSLAPGVEVVTSRALAPLPKLMMLARSVLDSGATGLFLTGEGRVDSGLRDAGTFDRVEPIPSLTQAGACIMRVEARSIDRRD